ncbi:interferon-inducible GTPase 5-like [Bufo gargarizans]|uniref:interferon-inducible GTPase 5-like n=1 Tax=Bufo gargarizans TaxID=30331 RepID=UPI001CF1CD55|nr:interferon-inducible GTPase 5-like [Bufo gargarizans]XP_044134666.1 interferon-inducible GTPase 5-like [Bufo gargarizans]
MESGYEIITEEEVQEIIQALKSAFEDASLYEAAERLSESLKETENAPLNIAITGESGTGKSTFVNAICGMEDEEEGCAKTGVVETTKEPMSYPHPQYPNVTVWDLPGIGTPNFVADNYLQSVELNRYDFFIIISSERFKQNDILLATAIQAMDKKFYFVRSKIDSELYACKKLRKKTYNKESILNEIRVNCIESLRVKGITEPQVFLLSCLDLDKYDFLKMQETLKMDLPKHKRHIFLISLPNISLPVIEKKQEALRKDIWKFATLSCAVATVQIPELSLICDVEILVKAMKGYQNAFGLNNQSLETLANKFGKEVSELRSVIKSPVDVKEIIKERATIFLTGGDVGALKIAEYIASTIPVLGTIPAWHISFSTIYRMLSDFLNETTEDAYRVLRKALE